MKDKKHGVSEALKAEEKLKSKWYVIDLKGKLHSIDIKNNKIQGYDFGKQKNLLKFAMYEMAKSREVKEQPPHVKLMQKLELVDYEPGSDAGNLRFYPKGEFIRDSIIDLVDNLVVADYGAMKMGGPLMFDFEHPSLKKYLNRFPARQYTVESLKKKYFLRFAACFGQFLMAKDATISYKNLPMKLYEMAKCAYRLEKRGELVGLRRLRAFVMPDCHAFCADVNQAKEELKVRLDLVKKTQTQIGFNIEEDFELAIRIVKDFYDENKDIVMSIVKKFGKPALVEIWDERPFYYIMKYELNFVDNLDKASALSTDQIDVENAQTYGIKYMDKDGKNKYPTILHCSPSGAIERVMYALLEKAAKIERQGGMPILPLWLSPSQVRIIPVSEKHLEYCKKLDFGDIRVGIDDSNNTVGKKVSSAKQNWIPYVVVVGDKEIKSKKLMVTRREDQKDRAMTVNELVKEIKEKTKGMPNRPMPLPKLLSKRPIFYG